MTFFKKSVYVVLTVVTCNFVFLGNTSLINAATVVPPSINSFSAAPPNIGSGQTTTLSWVVGGATLVSIDQGVGNVTNLSSIIVAPSKTTTYTLTASNSAGIKTASLSVTVAAGKSAQTNTTSTSNQLAVQVRVRPELPAQTSISVPAGGSYILSAATLPSNITMLDAFYSVCQLANPDSCSTPIAVPWGNYSLVNGSVKVSLPANMPNGIYKAQFRPRNQTNWSWSNEIVITVTPLNIGKASFHRFSNLRAGMINTSNGWNVQDFALHFVNTSNQDIDVTWKMIADDPNFVFRDGSVGVFTKVLPVNASGFQALNIAAAEYYSFPILPYTNFTGSTEVSACVRGSSPCVPANFYAYLLAETPIAVGPDPNRTWFDGWDDWNDDVPVSWDPELGSFIVPYTNYWHNVASFPEGWHSRLIIHNNSTSPGTYYVKHIPDDYSHIAASPTGGDYYPYQIQTIPVTVAAGGMMSSDLEDLFGWREDVPSFMEGHLVITPASIALAAQSVITSQALPNPSGAALSAVHNNYGVILSIVSPLTSSAPVSGVVQLKAHVAQNRGANVSEVVFYMDGQPICDGNVCKATSPNLLAYDAVMNWNTAFVSAGPHEISVKAFRVNSQGVMQQVGNIPSSTVTVQNTSSPNALIVDVRLPGAPTGSPAIQVPVGGTYVLHAGRSNGIPNSGLLDALYSVCQVNNSASCSTPMAVAWGDYTLDAQGYVTINLPVSLPQGIYRSQFRPRNQTSVPWSNQIRVTVSSGTPANSAALKTNTSNIQTRFGANKER